MGNLALNEKRKYPRRRVFKGGQISFRGLRAAIDCTIRDHSETGAKLSVETPVGISEKFDLLQSGTPTRFCRAAWRKSTHIGVEFIHDQSINWRAFSLFIAETAPGPRPIASFRTSIILRPLLEATMGDDQSRPNLTVVSENSGRDIKRSVAWERASHALVNLAANLLPQGAGRLYKIERECNAVVEAFEEYQSIVGVGLNKRSGEIASHPLRRQRRIRRWRAICRL
ncbi:hypothetical protein [Rhodoblastus sp.]|jgi:hypothetical protein|uniref:hypothetical protein n=1 Tax=Rhodoblastus sp. TaxID=1962975 RepID=UPI0025EC181B|nr:hypothetical protein [Rhodoblastus sp.]